MALRPAPQLELRPLRELTNRVVTCDASAKRQRTADGRPACGDARAVHPLVGRKPARSAHPHTTRPRAPDIFASQLSSQPRREQRARLSVPQRATPPMTPPHRPPGATPPTYSSSTQLFNWDTSNKGCGTAPLRLPYRFKMSCNWAVKFKRAGVKGDFVALTTCDPGSAALLRGVGGIGPFGDRGCTFRCQPCSLLRSRH